MSKKPNQKSNDLLPWRVALHINHRALSLIARRYPHIILSRMLCVIWSALTPYVGIVLSAQIIGELAGARDAARLNRLVWITLISAALISLVTALLHRWRNVVCTGMYHKVEKIFSDKMLDMDFVRADDPKTRELLSTIRQNQNGGGWGLYRVIGSYEKILSALFTLLGGAALTVSLFTSRVPAEAGWLTVLNNPLAVLLTVVLMLAVTYLAPMLGTKADSYYARNAGAHNLGNRLFGHFGFLGYRAELAADMRIYRQDLMCDPHNQDKTDIFHSAGMFAKLARGPMGLYRAASSAVSVVFTAFVYLFVCLKAWAGAFDIGQVTQYVTAITRLSGSVGTLIGTLGSMRNNAAFLSQVFEYLDIPSEMHRGTAQPDEQARTAPVIEFRDVSFRYPAAEEYALRHVNLTLCPGERLAVVGRNGSGKTTAVKLLCRLYDPTEGEILLNGVNIRDIDYDTYLSLFAVVFQDFKLFPFKLGANVAAGEDCDADRARDCLQKAGFGDRLASLPQGLDTYLYKDFTKKGTDISGGEAQKIALARALYPTAPVVVLDEPTAALDPIAEADIYRNFNDMVGDRTAIYISHRLSSCRFCDRVAVFEQGELVQCGTHDTLLADPAGQYHALWNAQAQYYTEGASSDTT